MPSRIYEICNRYESGYGHGLNEDGFDLSKTPHADPELGEAYQIGYEAGLEGAKVKREAFELAGDIVDLVTPNAALTGERTEEK